MGFLILNMAKRFIDTGLLKHHFTRGLEAPLKLLWVHLLTDCNNAGMWQVDFEIAEIIIGQKIDRKKAEKSFENKVVKLKGGAIWFIPDFIDFQYGKLQEKNPAHKNIIVLLLKENLIDSDRNLKGLPSTFGVPSKGTMDKDKDKVMEKVMEKEKESDPEIFEIDPHPYLKKIKSDYPVLLKMKEPLTEAQAQRLEIDIGDDLVYEKLEAMANKANILKNYISANLTLRTWVNYSNKNGKPTTKTSGEKIGRVPIEGAAEFLSRGRIAPID
jgi:hypothetical protein